MRGTGVALALLMRIDPRVLALAFAVLVAPRFALAEPRPAPSPPAVHVRLTAPKPMVVEEQLADGSYRALCRTPCERALRRDGIYRVAGSRDVRATEPFSVTEAQGDAAHPLLLDVEPRGQSGFVLGVAGTALGGVLSGGSLLYWLGASALNNVSLGESSASEKAARARSQREVNVEAGVAFTVGVALLVAGIVAVKRGAWSPLRGLEAAEPAEGPTSDSSDPSEASLHQQPFVRTPEPALVQPSSLQTVALPAAPQQLAWSVSF